MTIKDISVGDDVFASVITFILLEKIIIFVCQPKIVNQALLQILQIFICDKEEVSSLFN